MPRLSVRKSWQVVLIDTYNTIIKQRRKFVTQSIFTMETFSHLFQQGRRESSECFEWI